MLSDEEKKAIEGIKKDDEYYNILENIKQNKYNMWNVEKLMRDTTTGDYTEYEIAQSIVYFVNLIEKQSKEIEELSDKLTEKICKGVEEEILEEYRQTIISKDKEIEELKEDKYGLEEEVQIQAKNLMLYENALSEIQDKIKAKIEYYEKIDNPVGKRVLQSLLEKE